MVFETEVFCVFTILHVQDVLSVAFAVSEQLNNYESNRPHIIGFPEGRSQLVMGNTLSLLDLQFWRGIVRVIIEWLVVQFWIVAKIFSSRKIVDNWHEELVKVNGRGLQA